MTTYNLTYKPYGKYAILIEWPSKIDKNILNDILKFRDQILNNNTKVIVDVINTYNSLTVIYSLTIENIYNEILRLKSIYRNNYSYKFQQKYKWAIPVCYDEEFGIDLHRISRSKNITIEEIIDLHAKAIYTVYFIGFLPGFLYLGGLNEMLHLTRKDTPRLNVAKGSVAIGGEQTGVYPIDSAGGWHIIGRTPISFFNVKAKNPCFASSGDEIEFKSISKEQFIELEKQIESGTYQLKNNQIND